MSIRRFLERKALGQTFDFAARREQLARAEARRAERADAEAQAGEDVAAVVVTPSGVRRVPHIKRALLKKAAAAAATVANDDFVSDPALRTPYENQLVALGTDLKRLKMIQGTDAKVALKRELLGNYLSWVLGRLEAAPKPGSGEARPGQDQIVSTMLVWAVDTGDYTLALELAEYCHRFDLALPPQLKRDLPNFVTEEIADAALVAFRAAGDAAGSDTFPTTVLTDVETLFADADMFDQVRAKLRKAIGLALLAAVSANPEPAAATALRRAALEHLKEAQRLNAASGCVKLIEGIEREIKKAGAPPA